MNCRILQSFSLFRNIDQEFLMDYNLFKYNTNKVVKKLAVIL